MFSRKVGGKIQDHGGAIWTQSRVMRRSGDSSWGGEGPLGGGPVSEPMLLDSPGGYPPKGSKDSIGKQVHSWITSKFHKVFSVLELHIPRQTEGGKGRTGLSNILRICWKSRKTGTKEGLKVPANNPGAVKKGQLLQVNVVGKARMTFGEGKGTPKCEEKGALPSRFCSLTGKGKQSTGGRRGKKTPQKKRCLWKCPRWGKSSYSQLDP